MRCFWAGDYLEHQPVPVGLIGVTRLDKIELPDELSSGFGINHPVATPSEYLRSLGSHGG